MCSYDDNDAAARFVAETMRTARRPHRCGECGRWIEPGERYQHVSALTDGDFWQAKTCEGCLIGQKWVRTNCGFFYFGTIRDELRSHFDGEEAGIWDGTYTPEFRSATWRPSMTKLWVGRVIVGMRRQWRGVPLPQRGAA